jgi:GNAT superfamily N-acetyltransferase
MSWYIVRQARHDDFDDIVQIEKEGFPEDMRDSAEVFEDRFRTFQRHIYIIEYAGMVIGYINGMVTDSECVTDEMYKDAGLHREDGEWQTVLGFSVRKGYRNKGYASRLMERFISAATKEGRRGVILICQDDMIPFYEKLGFKLKGKSQMKLGGADWYDMYIECKRKRKHNYTSKIYIEENRI